MASSGRPISIMPGRRMMIAPVNPTSIAATRRGPTRSRRKITANRVMNSGMVKWIAMPFASSTSPNAQNHITMPTKLNVERRKCMPICRVFSA